MRAAAERSAVRWHGALRKESLLLLLLSSLLVDGAAAFVLPITAANTCQ